MNVYEVRSSTCCLLAAAAFLLVSGCAGYVPGRQAYWDAQVTEMCARDGGVRIFHKLRISESDIPHLLYVGRKIAVPSKELASPKAPAYYELRVTPLKHEGNLQVSRTESTTTRRSDGAIVARWVSYTRSGGDFPSHAYPSHFTCPDMKVIGADLQQLFVLEGRGK